MKKIEKATSHFFRVIFMTCLLLIGSCGQDSEDKIDGAILSANNFLNSGKCREAIDVLNGVGFQSKNARYLIALASAYACLTGFNEPGLFTDDLQYIGSPSALGGFTRFSRASQMQSFDDDDYDNLQIAIDLLLYAGGIPTTKDPTPERRSELLTLEESESINSFLLYMIMEQLGHYLYYYGNTTSAGVKGGRDSDNISNDCIVNYSNVTLDVGVDLSTYFGTGVTGSCTALNTGHPDLGNQGSLNVKRLCQGVVLLNNFFEILPEVIASASGVDDLSVLGDLTTPITTAKGLILAAKASSRNVLNVLSQSRCESENASDTDDLEVFFAFLYETLFT